MNPNPYEPPIVAELVDRPKKKIGVGEWFWRAFIVALIAALLLTVLQVADLIFMGS